MWYLLIKMCLLHRYFWSSHYLVFSLSTSLTVYLLSFLFSSPCNWNAIFSINILVHLNLYFQLHFLFLNVWALGDILSNWNPVVFALCTHGTWKMLYVNGTAQNIGRTYCTHLLGSCTCFIVPYSSLTEHKFRDKLLRISIWWRQCIELRVMSFWALALCDCTVCIPIKQPCFFISYLTWASCNNFSDEWLQSQTFTHCFILRKSIPWR